jgi:hypothetical protein
MKSLVSILVIIAASTVFTAKADPNLLAGPRLGKNTPAIALVSPYSNVADPNLVAGPRLGKHTPEVKFATVAGVQDPDLLAGIKKCAMAPKIKDTPACAKHCCATENK